MITKDTRLAWAIARDDGIRSQHESVVDKLEVGCDVQIGVRGGVGAAVNVEYAKVASCIASLPKGAQATGDAMNCRGVLSDSSYKKAASMAALAAAQMVVMQTKGFPQWSPERKRLMYWVALAAVERSWVMLHAVPEKIDANGRQEGRTLDEPWKVGKWLRGKHDQTIDLKNWGKQWASVWDALQDAITEMDDVGIDAVDDCIKAQRNAQKTNYALQG